MTGYQINDRLALAADWIILAGQVSEPQIQIAPKGGGAAQNKCLDPREVGIALPAAS